MLDFWCAHEVNKQFSGKQECSADSNMSICCPWNSLIHKRFPSVCSICSLQSQFYSCTAPTFHLATRNYYLNRLFSSKKIASYCGCVPKKFSSHRRYFRIITLINLICHGAGGFLFILCFPLSFCWLETSYIVDGKSYIFCKVKA